MLATLGDLVDDVVVRLGEPFHYGADTAADVGHRRGGSAANVADVAARLGAAARFLGQVGDDVVGDGLTAELAASGVDVSAVRRGGATGTIIVVVDHTGERSMLTDRRACLALDRPEPAWLDGITALHVPFYSLAPALSGPSALVDTATTLIGWAHERDIAVTIDASSVSLLETFGIEEARACLRGLEPAVIFANHREADVLDLVAHPIAPLTAVKCGPDPALLVIASGEASTDAPSVVEVPAIAVDKIVDTTGAGDAFAGGFLAHGFADPVAACAAGHRAAANLLRGRSDLRSA